MAMGPAPLPSIGLVLGPRYALASAASAFAVTGFDATLTEAGLMGQAGAPAPFPSLGLVLEYVADRSLSAGAAAYTIDVAPALADYALTAQAAAYTLAGQDAIVAFGRAPLSAAAGAFALTGQFATLTGINEYRMVADVGAFAVSGVDVPVLAARALPAALGSAAVTGNDAGSARGLRLLAATGAYDSSGPLAQLRRSSGTATWGKRGRAKSGQVPRRTNTVF